MFSNLVKGHLFYILDKNNKLELKIGKVTDINTNPQVYNFAVQETDITVDVNSETYTFKKLPGNLSIASPSTGIVVSDNEDDMFAEVENTVKVSHQIVDSVPYHKTIIANAEPILAKLNPKFAKQKEQETKINNLENRMGGIEQGISNLQSMISKMLNQNKIE